MYTISRAAEQVGITAATLRAWERRYAVVSPQRTGGAYRVYSTDDVRTLRTMKRLVDEGWSAGFAAQEALQTAETRSWEEGHGEPASAPARDTDATALRHRLGKSFVQAAADLDAGRLDDLLDQMMAVGRFEAAVATCVFPALEMLGHAWESGRVSVAGEHLAANAVGRRLATAYEAAASSAAGARVLVGLAPGRRHELGLLAFAVAARRVGIRADYLGADVPVAAWLKGSSEPDVEAVVMAIQGARDAASTARVVSAIHRHHPGVLIAAGGAEQERAPAGVLRLGHDFGQAAQALQRAVAR